MSTRWHLMSRRPSSKTANRPTGPAPTMTTSVEITLFMNIEILSLLARRGHDEAVQILGHLDLAREPGVRAHLEGEIEHVLLHLRGLADDFSPLRRHIDVASGAGARAATFG